VKKGHCGFSRKAFGWLELKFLFWQEIYSLLEDPGLPLSGVTQKNRFSLPKYYCGWLVGHDQIKEIYEWLLEIGGCC
jgi:hypothetical protein